MKNLPDKIVPGMVIGKLTIIHEVESEHGVRWQCRCECGNEVIFNNSTLRAHQVGSCGCSAHFEDLTGRKYGTMTVLYRDKGSLYFDGRPNWVCQCDCGVIKTMTEKCLKDKRYSPSCGNHNGRRPLPILQLGEKVGKLTIIKEADLGKKGGKMWLCKCECGNEIIVDNACMSRGSVRSCGCAHEKKAPDLLGQRFGRLTVLFQTIDNQQGVPQWACQCDCGNLALKTYRALTKDSKVPSCGCYGHEKTSERNRTHGLSKDPLHSVWSGMLSRCYNKNDINYKNYGGRGIYVCERWRNNFQNFYDDMHDGYAPGLQIDRIDNDGPYAPENTRWVTQKENLRNTSRNHFVDSVYGYMTLAELAEKSGMKYGTLATRVKLGYPDKLLTMPRFSGHGGKNHQPFSAFTPLIDEEEKTLWVSDDDEIRLFRVVDLVEAQVREYKQKLEDQNDGSGQG